MSIQAKYRLITDLDVKEEEMIYCSKCAINLLQQGFKVEELKPSEPLTSKLARSQQNFGNFGLQNSQNSMLQSVGTSTRVQ